MNSHFDRDEIMAELEEKGYCVIPDVMTPEECDARIGEYRDWLVKFGDGDWPFQRHSIIQSYRIGHMKPTWEVRLATKKVFEMVWQTKKLLTSFDAVAIGPPPEEDTQAFNLPGSNWLHIDQSAKRQGLHAYQGGMYLERADDTDYCFRVLSGSHKHVSEYYRLYPGAAARSRKLDFSRVQEEEEAWFREQHDCQLTKVPVPKGGMVLWDSRTVHDNCRPEFGRPNSDRWRFVVFVCMAPAQWARPSDLAQKREAFKKMVMTSHWPAQGVSFFEERSMDADQITLLQKLPSVARLEEAQLLAGVKEYDFEDGEPNGPAWEPEWDEE